MKKLDILRAIRKTEAIIVKTEEKLRLLRQLQASLMNAKAGYPVPEARERQLSLPFESGV